MQSKVAYRSKVQFTGQLSKCLIKSFRFYIVLPGDSPVIFVSLLLSVFLLTFSHQSYRTHQLRVSHRVDKVLGTLNYKWKVKACFIHRVNSSVFVLNVLNQSFAFGSAYRKIPSTPDWGGLFLKAPITRRQASAAPNLFVGGVADSSLSGLINYWQGW